MALFEYSRRRADLDNEVRSDDRKLNVFFVFLWIAYVLGSLYSYGRTDPIAGTTSTSSYSQLTLNRIGQGNG